VVSVSVRVVLLGSEQEAKAAHFAKMRRVAECIVDPVPSWLIEVLSDFSFNVWSQDSIDKMWPTRKEMWDSLATIGSLAIALGDALNKPGVAGFLVTNSEIASEDALHDLSGDLSILAGRAAKARKSPLLVGTDGEILPGAGRPLLPGTMPAKYVCAAVIAEVMSFLAARGCASPPQQDARNAADLYWKAWPQKSKGWGSDPRKGWERYFDAADDARLEPIRNEVRRHLSIRARDGI
jgi:hypothetical protein